MSCISDIMPPVCHDDGYDQDEVIRYFKECSDRIRPLYIKAGWETATELWDEIDKTLKANGEQGDTFDVPKRFKTAAGLSPVLRLPRRCGLLPCRTVAGHLR